MSIGKLLSAATSPKKLFEAIDCVRVTRQWPAMIAMYSGFQSVPKDFVVETRSKRVIPIEDRDELTTVWHVFFGKEYTIPRNSHSILDLGANIGAFAVWVVDQCPSAQVHSVEPFPSTYERLVDTVTKNNLQDRVQCHNLAVSDINGVVSFDATEGKRSYCRTILDEGSNSPAITVRSCNLTTLLADLQMDTLDCLKMDVEGAEYPILLTTDKDTLRRIKLITLEYHDIAKTPPLWKHLESSGFRCTRQIDCGWSGLATFEQILN